MRKLLKRSISSFLIPLTKWYLRKERAYTYQGLTVKVFQGVFHPGLFHSTKFLLGFLSTQSLHNKSLLELGCGTGLISIFSAKNGAIVTASDVSQMAIKNIATNVSDNQVSVEIVRSDVFGNLGEKVFDWIIINPPYYAKSALNESELAWHCGEDFEYFRKLFKNLGRHIHTDSSVIMVLTLGCELERIFDIARNNGFQFQLTMERNAFFDGKDFLYRIKRAG
jgi:release factor glutamine methyltransferase